MIFDEVSSPQITAGYSIGITTLYEGIAEDAKNKVLILQIRDICGKQTRR
jgi:hypothetical protein